MLLKNCWKNKQTRCRRWAKKLCRNYCLSAWSRNDDRSRKSVCKIFFNALPSEGAAAHKCIGCRLHISRHDPAGNERGRSEPTGLCDVHRDCRYEPGKPAYAKD